MRRHPSLIAALFAVSAVTAEAQSSLLAAGELLPVSATTLRSDAGGAELLSENARVALQERRGFRPGTLAFGVLGAAIGAGTGFLVSQMVHSDWDKVTNSTFASHRRTFALTGAGVGLITAFVLDRSAPSRPGMRVRNAAADRQGSGGAITLSELRESSAQNAYEAVASLRPQWLVERGGTLGSFGTLIPPSNAGNTEGPQSFTGIPGEQRIGAYLDGMALDGVDALRRISIMSIARIEFRTASMSNGAGPGYVHRAIVVISADGTVQ